MMLFVDRIASIVLLLSHRIASLHLRKVVLRDANWSRPQDEDDPESFFQVESLFQVYNWEPFRVPRLPTAWYDLLAELRGQTNQTSGMPQVQTYNPTTSIYHNPSIQETTPWRNGIIHDIAKGSVISYFTRSEGMPNTDILCRGRVEKVVRDASDPGAGICCVKSTEPGHKGLEEFVFFSQILIIESSRVDLEEYEQLRSNDTSRQSIHV